MCISCCSRDTGRCRLANETSQCDYAIEKCNRYDDDVCGIQFSSPEQAAFCEIDSPIVWPPSLDIPEEKDRAREYQPDVVFFTTGNDSDVNQYLTERLIRDIDFPQSIPTNVVRAAGFLLDPVRLCRKKGSMERFWEAQELSLEVVNRPKTRTLLILYTSMTI